MKKTLKIISLIMAVLTLVPCIGGCTKKGNEKVKDPNYYIKLNNVVTANDAVIDFGSDSFASKNPSLVRLLSDEHVYEGEAKTFHWTAESSVGLNGTEVTDWSGYEKVVFSVYSGKKTGATLQVRFSNPKTSGSSGMGPYSRYGIVVGWTGWKTFEIDITETEGTFSWANITGVSFDMSGWNLDARTGNDLYISNIRLVSSEYQMEVPDGVSLSDSSIYDKVKDQWREYSLGSSKSNKSKGDDVKEKLEKVSSACKSSWDTFKRSYKKNTRDSAFGLSIVQGRAGDESKINTIYNNILNMAKGYGTYGSDYYHNESLLEDIVKALDYCYTFYYGPNVWEEGTYGNWWYWDIGIPLVLSEILIDIEKDVDYESLEKWLSPFDYLDEYPSMTACNKIWVSKCILASAFLQEDAERIMISKTMMNDVFDYVTQNDGFYEDGSFIQHGAFPYTAGYGNSMLSTLSEIMLVLRGSRFDFTEDNVSNVYRWVFENFQPVIYGPNMMASMKGREVDRNGSERSAFYGVVSSMINMTTFAPDDVLTKLESLIRYYMNIANDNFASTVPLMLIDYAIKLNKNDKVQPRSDYEFLKVFGNMDRIVQHGDKYGVCVALNSTRIFKYEALNNENMDGWYQTDGMIYIYTDGYDYDYNFFNYVNPYRMPGTTVSTVERKAESLGGFYGNSPFVGGVEAGKYGIAVFTLGYPQTSYSTPDITANKSYFMFDNEIVCVGSAIKEQSGNEVITVVENRNIREGDTFIVDGKETKLIEDRKTPVKANYMHFTNMGGYVFLDGTEVTYNKSDKIKTSFLEIWLSHGTNPTEGKYSYIYLPEATAGQTAVYQQNPDVQILEQTNDIHVVKETKLGITGYAFYKAGKSNGVEVSSPCCVMISEENGEKVISISDPTHLLSSFTVTVDVPGVSSVVSADEGASCQIGSEKVTITVNQIDCSGETYTVRVK